MSYVDAFLTPIANDRIDDYRPLAELSAMVWREHGALDYREYLLDDHKIGQHCSPNSFAAAAGAQEGEAVVLAIITYPSKAERDTVNEKAQADPRLEPMTDENVPFDGERMIFAGFKAMVE